MLQLFEFIARKRNFILFVVLEVFSFWLIVNNNNYWSVNYFNTSNSLVAKALTVSNSVKEYSNLRNVNESLAEENRRLRQQITVNQQLKSANAPAGYQPDSAFAARYQFVTIAKVVDNSTSRTDNYLTIDKGTDDGVKERMGVMSPDGIVGIVTVCNKKFSKVTSILHSQFSVGAMLLRSGDIGTVTWQTSDPSVVALKDISRYKKVFKGDTAVTSNFSSVFPPGVTIGRIQKIAVSIDQSQFDIELKLGLDFTKLSYVYLVANKLQAQQESLQKPVLNARK
ncbi:MAG: rod shape-determining protein MreC [Cytophagia bacterium]|nr:MAG: rod shape-determining protein MreC [Runella sp.]TAG19212.1 MAG: rod shape-determining protein MreC [Cytophagales bacterium]TAG38481.1 MAG: rod shape-determining protein MreC [Cytophagia bacterium]TAG51642.1 MAG: rod shape-determining protein MreC [Runella slithyformis]TAG69824.1 MAG: rod shape-determining protein MreC [Runella slithyformis]